MSPPPRFAHQPALDGLRGLAVLAVLAFHLRWAAASGGFLGVSFFFTLSGFLITSLLLAEHAATARVDLRAFYARRIRRLLPGQLLCLALVLALVAARPAVYPGRRMAGDVGWAASQLFNWHLLGDHRTYADLFARQVSPLEHFWSLAVEEQIYLVFPLLVALFLARPAARRIGLAVLALAIVVPSLLAGQVGGNTAYLATPFRMTEFAVGVAAALLLARWARDGMPRVVAAVKGPAALVAGAALVIVVVATTLGSGWVYRGGLTAVAAAGAMVLVGASGATGGPARLLATGPLPRVGLVSYGLYLYHWPVFLTVDTFTWGRGALGALVKLVVTALLAVASFHLLEQPVRRRRPRAAWRAVAVAVAGVALLLAVVATADPLPDVVTATEQIDGVAADAVGLTTSTVALPGAAPTNAGGVPGVGGTVPEALPTVLLVGDSTAASLGAGLVEAAAADPAGTGRITVNASGACGLVRGGDYQDEVLDSALKMTCPAVIWEDAPALAAATAPMYVVILVSLPDTWERSWDGGITWADPAGSADFQRRLATDYGEYAATMTAAGAGCVLFLRPPVALVDLGDGMLPERSFTDGSHRIVAAVVDEVAADPQVGWVAFGDDYDAGRIPSDAGDRPDGIHFSRDAATRLGRDWFWPMVRDLAAEGACPDGPLPTQGAAVNSSRP